MYELTYNYGQDKYDNFHGEGYAQVAMSTEVNIPQTLPGLRISLYHIVRLPQQHDM